MCIRRPCFFGWLKQFNHSHPLSTNFNQLQPLLSTIKFHCIQFSTHFNLLQPTSPIYHPLFTTERNRPEVKRVRIGRGGLEYEYEWIQLYMVTLKQESPGDWWCVLCPFPLQSLNPRLTRGWCVFIHVCLFVRMSDSVFVPSSTHRTPHYHLQPMLCPCPLFVFCNSKKRNPTPLFQHAFIFVSLSFYNSNIIPHYHIV